MFIDTHCHVHESSYPLDRDAVLQRAHQAGVEKLMCIGTNEQSSKEAIEFARRHERVFATVGVHPHDTKYGWGGLAAVVEVSRPSPATLRDNLQPESEPTSGLDITLGAKPGEKGGGGGVNLRNEKNKHTNNKLVAIGETGLDYFYTHSPRAVQIEALQAQIELALKYNLPIIFHVRASFDDFWPIFDNFSGIRGELHSFTDTQRNLDEGLKRGLYIGVNGISTFAKGVAQKTLFKTIPLERLLLETDAPFLTPAPLRGRVNEPAFVKNVAEYNARIRGLSVEEIAAATTANANALFAFH